MLFDTALASVVIFMGRESACLSCGACCAYFRVSFYWGEAQSAGGVVPDNLLRQVNLNLACMEGTQSVPARCFALMGDVGQSVRCTIYENRPSTCREFQSTQDTLGGNAFCDKARAAYGLPPLTYEPSYEPPTPSQPDIDPGISA